MDVYSCSSISRLVGFFLSSNRAEPLATVEAAVIAVLERIRSRDDPHFPSDVPGWSPSR